MARICAAGELLIDFTRCGTAPGGQALYARNPGGAPANVLAMASKLGAAVSLFAKVGNDDFGDFLLQSMAEAGIETGSIHRASNVRTTIAFVNLDENGDRSFTFYRKPGADILLDDRDIPKDQLSSNDIFHFSGVSLTDDPAHGTVLRAAVRAKECGCLISFDPNYRPFLWSDPETARKAFFEGITTSDIIKLSDDELFFLTNTSDLRTGGKEITKYGPSLVLISCGANGSVALTSDGTFVHSDAFPVAVQDTTGAGDAFLGAALTQLAGKTLKNISQLSAEELQAMLTFCNAAGSLTTTKLGAIPSLPKGEEIELLIRRGAINN